MIPGIFPTDLKDSTEISCCLHTEGCHADFADLADCQLIYPCSSVSLRLTKTDIHPLKSMGRCPAVMLPLYSYKNEFLTPKP